MLIALLAASTPLSSTVIVSKEEMPADLDAIMLQQTDDAKEHVLLLEMLWHTNIEDLHPLSGVVTLVCRSSIMSSTNMVAAYLSWFKLSDVTPQEWEPSLSKLPQWRAPRVPVGTLNHVLLQEVGGGGVAFMLKLIWRATLTWKSSPGKPPLKLTIVILPYNDTLRLGGKVLAQGNNH